MLSAITDIKNFAVGTIAAPLSYASRWGQWGLGYGGDLRAGRQGEWRGMRFNGLFWPGVVAGAVAAPFMGVAGIAVFAGVWLGGTLALVGAGLAYGALTGGVREMRAGWKARAADYSDEATQQQKTAEIELINDHAALKDALRGHGGDRTYSHVKRLLEAEERVVSRGV